MNLRRKQILLLILLAALGTSVLPLQAGGPQTVTGSAAPPAGQGRAFRWVLDPIPYTTDKGGLGNQSNAQANDLVASAFQAWHDVGSALVHVQSTGTLSVDVTGVNIGVFLNGVLDCTDASQPVNAIMYDLDGSILEAMGYDNNATLGFSGSVCKNEVDGIYTRGMALLNGRFIDGRPETPSHSTVTLNEFKAVFIHEFGHLIGLDHSQINLNCLTNVSCPPADLAGLPIMFPILLPESGGTLKADDIASVSRLYPAPSFANSTGRIQGHVFFPDGITPAQGYNVIARKVGDPRTTALSCVSGFLFTAAAGNPNDPNRDLTESQFGSRDPSLIGFYDISGLPPGDYTIEVEAIYDSGLNAFTGGSSVGPIGDYGFNFKLPGTCNPQYLNYPSSPNDSCSAFTTVSVGAGTVVNTNTDVIFLGAPFTRFDAWEDEGF